MTDALGRAPLQKRKQVHCFTDMRQYDDDKTTRTEQLEKRGYRLSFEEGAE